MSLGSKACLYWLMDVITKDWFLFKARSSSSTWGKGGGEEGEEGGGAEDEK